MQLPNLLEHQHSTKLSRAIPDNRLGCTSKLQTIISSVYSLQMDSSGNCWELDVLDVVFLGRFAQRMYMQKYQ